MKYLYMPTQSPLGIHGGEPTITDDAAGNERSLSIGCAKIFTADVQYTVGADVELWQAGVRWYVCKIATSKYGYTTFSDVNNGSTGQAQTLQVVSGSYSYDGETESFQTPILDFPVYANQSLTCSKFGKVSAKNRLSVDPSSGVITVERVV
jgi:hypothetical protein